MSIGVAAVSGIIGGAAGYFGWRKWSDAKLLENLPTSKVRSIAMGLVELEGLARTDKPLETPIEGKECVCFEFRVERKVRDKNGNRKYKTVHREQEVTRAVIQDDTGQVLINLQDVDMQNGASNYIKSNNFSDPPARLQQYLDEKGVSWEGWFGINRDMRYIEEYIPVDDQVTVVGTAMDNPYVKEGTGQDNAKDVMIGKGGNRFFICRGDEETAIQSDKMVGISLLVVSILILGFSVYQLVLGLS